MRSLLPYISSKLPGGGSPRQLGVKLPEIFADQKLRMPRPIGRLPYCLMAAIPLSSRCRPRPQALDRLRSYCWASATNCPAIVPPIWGPLWFWSAMFPEGGVWTQYTCNPLREVSSMQAESNRAGGQQSRAHCQPGFWPLKGGAHSQPRSCCLFFGKEFCPGCP